MGCEMKIVFGSLLLSLLCGFGPIWAGPKKVTSVIETQTSQVTGAYGDEGLDCASKQQALRLQIQVCQDHDTLTSCLDQFYLPFKKKFSKCQEEASAICLEACAKSMPYSYCAKYCK